MKTNLSFPRLFLLALFALISFQVSSQIAMLPPVPAGGSSGFTKICAGIDNGAGPFNSYDVTIAWGGTANADNEFVLELSDANGDFTNAVELGRVGDQNTANPKNFDLNFSIPTDTRGEGYKFRARSTSPVSSAESDNTYPMYYMDITSNLNISELGDGVPPGDVCSDTAVTLQVDNISNPESYSYSWFRSGNPTPLTETGHTLNITTSGMYFALIDYGECSFNANTDSNIVTVTIGTAGVGIGITPPSKTALCPGETETLTIDSTDPTWSYQWYKDNTVISGATTTSYTVDGNTANFEGDYQVEISGNGVCTQRSAAVTMTNAGAFTVTRNNPANIVILPSQPETLSVNTTANTPSYQWYRNGVAVGGATNATLDITQDGTYYCAVTSTGSCSSTINSENTVAVVPTSFDIVVDYDSSYTACVNTSAVLEVARINAVASDGSTSDVTAQLETSFSYQWQLNGADISGAASQNISLTNPTENGNYSVNATLGSYNETSNMLPVQLLTSETVTITSTGLVYCSSSDTITIGTATDLTGESFSWERDGASVNTTDTILNVAEPGTYRLVLDKDGCPLNSNEIIITPLDPNLISFDVDGEVVFPEGSSKTVTASGGTAYQWFDEGNNLLSSTDQMTFTEEGTFTLVANVDNCQITRQLTAVYLDLFNVPNVITPNGDGANDQWVIPNSYSNKSDINVIIYNDKGEELINETSYANNWPQSSMSFPKQNMVFYYVIKNASETLKQGTITVIR
ncbi:gliding motility-associated C-terminal domain-containing protein [Maribacter sp. 2308TA10-17]|uniref:T9SS type B sorting domain-containing protein n=1 Tax=Maribacter sp. 2308TA10-17 TaxID=3386276 RepID=UPI0039BC2F34